MHIFFLKILAHASSKKTAAVAQPAPHSNSVMPYEYGAAYQNFGLLDQDIEHLQSEVQALEKGARLGQDGRGCKEGSQRCERT